MPVEEVQGNLSTILAQTRNKLVVVDFFAQWCGPCRMMAPLFERLSNEHTDVRFLKVDEASNREEVQSRGVRGFPTFHFYVDGRKVDEQVGANPQALESKVKEHKVQSFGGAGYSLGGGHVAATAEAARQARLRALGGMGGAPAAAAAPMASSGGDRAQSQAAPARVDAEMKESLLMMGFPEVRIVKALVATENTSVESAVEWMMTHEGDPDIDVPLEGASAPAAAPPAPASGIDTAAVEAAVAAAAGPRCTEDGVCDDVGGGESGVSTEGKAAEEGGEGKKEEEEEGEAAQAEAASPAQPLSEEEARAKLEELQAKLAERRAKEAEEAKKQSVQSEKQRRETGKGLLKQKEEFEAMQRRREIQKQKREKEAFKRERERLRLELLKDKFERVVENAMAEGRTPPSFEEFARSHGTIKHHGEQPQKRRAGAASPSKAADEAILKLKQFRAGGDGLRALKTCKIYVQNALAKDEDKYHHINMDNKAFKARISSLLGGIGLLQAAGFVKHPDARELVLEHKDEERLSMVARKLDEAIATME